MDSKQAGGIGFMGLLQITLIVLKFCGVITWSWVWVLTPLWGSALLAIAIVGFVVIMFFCMFLVMLGIGQQILKDKKRMVGDQDHEDVEAWFEKAEKRLFGKSLRSRSE